MESINAIYDGNTIKFLEPVPVKGKYEVKVIFTKSLEDKEAKKQRILKYRGIFDDDDVKNIEQVVEDRTNFFKNRGKYDIS